MDETTKKEIVYRIMRSQIRVARMIEFTKAIVENRKRFFYVTSLIH